MDIKLLQETLADFKRELEMVITSGKYVGKKNMQYAHGLEAKTALIRSQALIMRLHEVIKVSLQAELLKNGQRYIMYPQIGQSSPELSMTGFIKAKKQDVVVLFGDDKPQTEIIVGGPLDGMQDKIGSQQSQRAITIGVRSQLSSVNKNYDTLMERALAEAVNFHLRSPKLVMGEVYLLPVFEYDPRAMKTNTVQFLPGQVDVAKFLRIFFGISGRNWSAKTIHDDVFKYERSALILVDFRSNPPTLFLTLQELKEAGLVPNSLQKEIHDLSPEGFTEDIVNIHKRRHSNSLEFI